MRAWPPSSDVTVILSSTQSTLCTSAVPARFWTIRWDMLAWFGFSVSEWTSRKSLVSPVGRWREFGLRQNELERRTRANYSEDASYVARGHGDVVNDSAVIAYSAVPRLFGQALQSCSRSRACLPGISPRLRLSDGVPRASPPSSPFILAQNSRALRTVLG